MTYDNDKWQWQTMPTNVADRWWHMTMRSSPMVWCHSWSSLRLHCQSSKTVWREDAEVSPQQGYGCCSEWSPRPILHHERRRTCIFINTPSSFPLDWNLLRHPTFLGEGKKGDRHQAQNRVFSIDEDLTHRSLSSDRLTCIERWVDHLSDPHGKNKMLKTAISEGEPMDPGIAILVTAIKPSW